MDSICAPAGRICRQWMRRRRRHTRFKCDWSSDVCSSDLLITLRGAPMFMRMNIGAPRSVIRQALEQIANAANTQDPAQTE